MGCALASSPIDWLSPSDLDRMTSKPGWSAGEHTLLAPLEQRNTGSKRATQTPSSTWAGRGIQRPG